MLLTLKLFLLSLLFLIFLFLLLFTIIIMSNTIISLDKLLWSCKIIRCLSLNLWVTIMYNILNNVKFLLNYCVICLLWMYLAIKLLLFAYFLLFVYLLRQWIITPFHLIYPPLSLFFSHLLHIHPAINNIHYPCLINNPILM